jgi:hypothetical protein
MKAPDTLTVTLLITVLLYADKLYAQSDCYTTGTGAAGPISAQSTNLSCDDWKNYLPGYHLGVEQLKFHPVHRLRLSVSIVTNNLRDPWGSWTMNKQTDLDALRNFFNQYINPRLRNLQPDNRPNPLPTVDVWDTGIEIEIDDLYYIEDNSYTIISGIYYSPNFYNTYLKKPNETKNMFIGRSTFNTKGFGTGLPQYINMFNQNFLDDDLFVHEFGHMLGLNHTNIVDILDTPTENCPTQTECSMNYMNSDRHGRWYFSPMQITVMRMNLEANLMHYFQGGTGFGVNHQSSHTKQLADCFIQSANPWQVTTDETWIKAMVIDRNILIKSPNTLTLQCKLSMPKDGKIIVESGAKLIVDGGLITSCNMDWGGIEIQPTASIQLIGGSIINLSGNAGILIERDPIGQGKMIYNQGSFIILNDPNTVLEIKGDLELGPGADFTFTGNGYIRFDLPQKPGYRNITATPTSTITLSGAGTGQKIAEVAGGSYISTPDDMGRVTFENGAVFMGRNAWVSVGGATRLHNLLVTGDQNNKHGGFFTNGHSDIHIQQVRFEHGTVGLTT